jgi:hypothetical protein
MLPSLPELVAEFRVASRLHFLVVDDNALNKSVFERNINNMSKEQDRAVSMYTLLQMVQPITLRFKLS